MKQTGVIINKIARSGIITLDLGAYYPVGEFLTFDIKEFLFMGLILKEKDFRKSLKTYDWTAYENQYVAITCSADAIVPKWAYMLIAAYLSPIAKHFVFGTTDALLAHLFIKNINQHIRVADYEEKRVVIKGCGDKPIPAAAYVEITRLLKPVVKSLMYGEPCSTVPIYKKPRK